VKTWPPMAKGEGRLPAQVTTRVGQGPPGGRTYIYTQKHTDQENESVNHIRYMHICDHIGTYLWSQKVYTQYALHSTLQYVTM